MRRSETARRRAGEAATKRSSEALRGIIWPTATESAFQDVSQHLTIPLAVSSCANLSSVVRPWPDEGGGYGGQVACRRPNGCLVLLLLQSVLSLGIPLSHGRFSAELDAAFVIDSDA